MITYINKKKKSYYFFIPFVLVLSINEVQATITSGLLWKKYNHEHNSKKNKHSFFMSKANKSLDNRKKIKYQTSVYDKNYIDRFSSSPEYKNFLIRLSAKKNINEVYKKLFEKKIKDKEEQIKDNKMMIQMVDTRLKRLINDYNKMLP